MIVNTNEGKTVGEVRKRFNELYPFLRIEFYQNSDFGRVIRKEKLDDGFCLAGGGMIDISGQRSVTDVKNDFLVATKLIAFVYRKSGNVWIETSHTDNWLLEQQNFEGEEMD